MDWEPSYLAHAERVLAEAEARGIPRIETFRRISEEHRQHIEQRRAYAYQPARP